MSEVLEGGRHLIYVGVVFFTCGEHLYGSFHFLSIHCCLGKDRQNESQIRQSILILCKLVEC